MGWIMWRENVCIIPQCVRLPVELIRLYLLMMWQLMKAKQQDELESVLDYIICSEAAECFKTHHWMEFNTADRQRPEADLNRTSRCFLRQRSGIFCRSGPWTESNWAYNSLAEGKSESKHPKNKQELKTSGGKTWQSFTREETQGLQTSVCSGGHGQQRI